MTISKIIEQELLQELSAIAEAYKAEASQELLEQLHKAFEDLKTLYN